MKILITGCAGFIGFSLANKLLETRNTNIYGIDNLNKYYDVKLKKDRLKLLKQNKNFKFSKIDITKDKHLNKNFLKNEYDIVIHLAAQAGVRYSISNPEQYVESNLLGFSNVIEAAKKINVKHFLFASSSSVYGNNKLNLLSENLDCNSPISFYAATKKSNEIVAFSYSHLFKLPVTALRFFTVYGPYGRPDMSPYKFVNRIMNNKYIELHNSGNHKRDFTYIDDIVTGILKLIKSIPKNKTCPYQILNIGSGKSINIKSIIYLIEKISSRKAKIKLVKLQKGDVLNTKADISKIKKLTGYNPSISIEEGFKKYIEWYKDYYE